MQSLVTDALATYRLTRLVVEDVVTADLRERIFEKYPPHDRSWSYALTCYHCTSMYAGAVVAVGRVAFPRAWNVISTALAASAVAGIMSERV